MSFYDRESQAKRDSSSSTFSRNYSSGDSLRTDLNLNQSLPNQSFYQPQSPSSTDKAPYYNPFSPTYSSLNSSNSNSNASLYGPNSDGIRSSYNTPNNDFKLSSNSDFDNYKPAYLNTPDYKLSSQNYGDREEGSSSEWGTRTYDDQSTGKSQREGGQAERSSISPSVPGTDPENLRYYHMLNTSRRPYKLKYYLYFSEDLNKDFDVHNYIRMDSKLGRPPMLQHYLRFYNMKYDYELNPKGKAYGDMYTLTNDNQSTNIINSKEYKGRYANQLDYINFKTQVGQEKFN